MLKLESQVAELGSSLEKVNLLLDQKSPTISEAKCALKVCCEIYCVTDVTDVTVVLRDIHMYYGVKSVVVVMEFSPFQSLHAHTGITLNITQN